MCHSIENIVNPSGPRVVLKTLHAACTPHFQLHLRSKLLAGGRRSVVCDHPEVVTTEVQCHPPLLHVRYRATSSSALALRDQ